MLNVLRQNIFLILILILPLSVHGQWQDHVFGNSWIDYSKDYLRIEVSQPGIQRIRIGDLPPIFQSKNPATFQLWYRGREVPILSINSEELLFYGELNDGASDSLLYRPYNARLNPYVSLFSDIGYYFLTTSPNPKKATTIDGTQNLTGEVEKFHIQKVIRAYQQEFSFATRSPGGVLNNSFYEEANAWGSKRIGGLSAYSSISTDTVLKEEVELIDWVKDASVKPEIEFLFNGLNVGRHHIFSMLSPDGENYRTIDNVSFVGYGGRKKRVTLENADFTASGKGHLKFISNTTDFLDWFSLSYFSLTYPQKVDLKESNSKKFYFGPSAQPTRRVKIGSATRGTLIYDITDIYNPKIIQGKELADGIEFGINQSINNELHIIAVNSEGIVEVSKNQLHLVNLQPAYSTGQSHDVNAEIDGSKYDYIILTTEALMEGAIEYARYRESEIGGGYHTLVVDIRMIHDVYNYGEPSPISIRSFMKSMLKDYDGGRKNLFLIGYSVTMPSRVVKELPNEIPTFGDPGSDNLLVAGLAGFPADIQAIPVGRLKAFNNNEIRNYLAKVKAYESENFDIAWRKNVLHLSGGQNSSEVITLRDILKGLEPIVLQSDYSGYINSIAKSISSPTVEKINIANQINEGIGLVTFFGHGSQTVTDLDIGYASDVSRGYANRNKYPLMYFNGCGVGNIFTGYQVHILSDDWLVADNRGAIAIVANSYDSYVSTSAKHIRNFYEALFEQNGKLTIGEVLQRTSEKIIASGANTYDIANIHQVCLQGDPALVLVTPSDPDYLTNSENNDLFLRTNSPNQTFEQAKSAEVGRVVANGGIYREGDVVEVEVKLWYQGESDQVRLTLPAVRNRDTLWVNVDNLENLRRIEVVIDPQDKLTEFTKLNNVTDLPIEWDEIRGLTFYPAEPLRDRIPPRFKVLFDSREMANQQTITPNTEIAFVIGDDRVIDFETAMLEVYLKRCWDGNCEAETLEIQADWVKSTDSREFIITYQGEPLSPGMYELFLTGADRAGNSPPGGGYVIQFRVEEDPGKAAVTVSPNPATRGFVKFDIQNIGAESIEITLLNSQGVVVEQVDLRGIGSNKVWYWNTGNLSSGIYLYKIVLKGEAGKINTVLSGKVLLMN